MTKLIEVKEEWKDKLYDTDALFYGELEFYLDEYLPKFFSVGVSDVAFTKDHKMNDALFWFTVSWLVSMNFLDYGTSPRIAWLTEEGKKFKEYVLETPDPITRLLHMKVKHD